MSPDTTVKPNIAESREQRVLPTAEECEALQEHKFVKWAKEGAWMSYLRQTKDRPLEEEQRQEEFAQIWQEDIQENIKFLLENGELQDWKEFLAQKENKATAAPQAPVDTGTEIRPDENNIEQDEEKKPWWEEKVFVNRDSGETWTLKHANAASGKITLRSPDGRATLTKNLNELQKQVSTPGEAWSTQNIEPGPESLAAEDSVYFDRSYAQPILIEFLKVSEKERNASGIDFNMLFYFLEGPATGKIDYKWPVTAYDGRTISKDEYITEIKKLEKFVKQKEQNNEAAKELKSGERFIVKSGDITMNVDLSSPHPTIKGAWNATINIQDKRSGFGGNQIFMEEDIRAFQNGAKPDITTVNEIFKRPYPHLIHALKAE